MYMQVVDLHLTDRCSYTAVAELHIIAIHVITARARRPRRTILESRSPCFTLPCLTVRMAHLQPSLSR